MAAADRIPLDPQACKDAWWAFASRTREYCMLALHADGCVGWANDGAAFILGIERDQLVGCPVARFFTEEDIAAGVPEHELQVAALHGVMSDDRWMRRDDRSRFWATGVTVALSRGEGAAPAFLKIFRDYTEQKMLLRVLRNRADTHARDSEAKSVAIAVLAHEMRGPLSVVSMAAEVVDRLVRDDARLPAPLGAIRRGIDAALRLTQDLEEHSRAAAGKMHLEPGRLRLGDLLEETLDGVRHRLAMPGRAIDLLQPATPIVIEGDRLRLQQVFGNLVANALHYTPEPGRIWVTTTLEGVDALVRVSDEGIGIAPEMLDGIFEMFTQASATPSSRGLGVGLALVKTIVELHGGSVQARSEGAGKGSEFSVRLPLRQHRQMVRGGILHPPGRPGPVEEGGG